MKSRNISLGLENARIRILLVDKMLNEGRMISTTEIIRRLEQRGIHADRKSIYGDIYAIDRITPVNFKVGRNGGYQKCKFMETKEDGR